MKLQSVLWHRYIWLAMFLILSQALIISGPAAGNYTAADLLVNAESDPSSPEELLPDFREEDATIAGLPAPMKTIIKKIAPRGLVDLPGVGRLGGFSEPVAQFSTIYAEQNSGGGFSAEIILHIIFSRDIQRLNANLKSAAASQFNWKQQNLKEEYAVNEVEYYGSDDACSYIWWQTVTYDDWDSQAGAMVKKQKVQIEGGRFVIVDKYYLVMIGIRAEDPKSLVTTKNLLTTYNKVESHARGVISNRDPIAAEHYQELEEERARIARDYRYLKKGHLLYAEGSVSYYGNKKFIRNIMGKTKYGHVGIYIGDYQVPEGKRYEVRDGSQVPLKVFRNGEWAQLKLGEYIEAGDWIIGAVVEARWEGIVFNTVDGMKNAAKKFLEEKGINREPNYAWKTTDPPPSPTQVDKIIKFALNKVEKTEKGEITYWFGKQGDYSTSLHNPDYCLELWDCVSIAEAAYESAGLDPTPNHLDNWVSIQPQEQFDNIDRVRPVPRKAIDMTIHSPVNLHLYDSQDGHVGIAADGIFEQDIPNAYYYEEVEDLPQAIHIENVNDEYDLVIEAVGDGSFDLNIQDLNVSSPEILTNVEFQNIVVTKGDIATLKIGSTNNDYAMDIDRDGDDIPEQTINPSSLSTSSSSTAVAYAKTGLTFESRSRPAGTTVQIPINIEGISGEVGNIDLVIAYDPNVLEATEVIGGSLTKDSILESNISPGDVRIALADSAGFSGDGSVIYVRFNIIGNPGATSPLTIMSSQANGADYATLQLQSSNGVFEVIGIDEARGDWDGNGQLTAVDALSALQMAVGKRPEDLSLDMNGDGRVTSLDARTILKIVVGNE